MTPIFRSLLLALGVIVFTSSVTASDLELVVTVPVETKLDSKVAPDTLQVWLDMIAGAKGKGDTIDIEQFYMSSKRGEPMEKVIKALKAAAKRGVAIRVIVDKSFLTRENGGITELARIDNIETRTLDYSKVGGGVQHSKFFIVNRSDAYLGSANFDWRALKHVHETGVRSQDPHVVASLQNIFEADWQNADIQGAFQFPASTVTAPTIPAAKKVTFSASPIKDRPSAKMKSNIDSILALIKGAKKSVQIQTMEYTHQIYGTKTAWRKLEKELLAAAKKVQVQLLLDATKAKAPGLKELIDGGVEVKAVTLPQHSSGPIPFARLIHSKYVLVDGKSFWLGTDNIAPGYFLNSRGVGVVSSDTKASEQLSDIFEELWNSSYAQELK